MFVASRLASGEQAIKAEPFIVRQPLPISVDLQPLPIAEVGSGRRWGTLLGSQAVRPREITLSYSVQSGAVPSRTLACRPSMRSWRWTICTSGPPFQRSCSTM